MRQTLNGTITKTKPTSGNMRELFRNPISQTVKESMKIHPDFVPLHKDGGSYFRHNNWHSRLNTLQIISCPFLNCVIYSEGLKQVISRVSKSDLFRVIIYSAFTPCADINCTASSKSFQRSAIAFNIVFSVTGAMVNNADKSSIREYTSSMLRLNFRRI